MLKRIIRPILPQFQHFEKRLQRVLASDVALVQGMADHLQRSRGNRLRPALSLLTAQAIGDCSDRVVDAAIGIEIIHTATLIHDDVIDSADKRRGDEALNLRWGNQAAVLMGDFLLARALEILVGLHSMEVMQAATHAVSEVVQGEILEIQSGGEPETSVYFSMIDKKTASLIALSCQVGAILGGGTDEQISGMATFGKKVGIAFQITDDLLDFTGTEEVLGKPVGTDVRERKVTLPLIYALANCDNGDASKIQAKVQSGVQTDEDLEDVLRFVHRYRGIEDAKEEARNYANSGLSELAPLVTSEARHALELTTQYVVDRAR